MQLDREQLVEKIRKSYPFDLLDKNAINKLIEYSEVLFYEKDNLIYKEGSAASSLYILLEGEIFILREEKQAVISLNHILSGGIFGVDIFSKNRVRRSSARALKNIMVLRIPANYIKRLFSEIKSADLIFHALQSSYELLIQKKLNLFPGESAIFTARPNFLIYFPRLVFIYGFSILLITADIFFRSNNLISSNFFLWIAILVVLFLILSTIWVITDWRDDLYLFTNKRALNLNHRPLKSESVAEIPLQAITNHQIEQNLAGRVFHYGDILIKTYTGETRFKAITNAELLTGLLEKLVSQSHIKVQEEEIESFRKILSNRQEANQGNDEENQPPRNEEKLNYVTGAGSELISNKGGNALRTHWFILLKRTLIPSLMIISTMLIAIFFYVNSLITSDRLVLFMFLVVLLLTGVLWWTYQFFDWYNDRYIISENQIIDTYRKPFGKEERRTALLSNIQSIRFERNGLPGLLLNFGTVFIRIGDEEFTFNDVAHPASIQNLIFRELEKYLAGRKQAELSEQQIRVANWLDSYHQFHKEKD